MRVSNGKYSPPRSGGDGFGVSSVFWRGLVSGGALILWCVVLGGCAPLAQGYAAYDTRFARELVAGHDDVRGNYVEVRVSPRGVGENLLVTQTYPKNAGAAAKAVVPAERGGVR